MGLLNHISFRHLKKKFCKRTIRESNVDTKSTQTEIVDTTKETIESGSQVDIEEEEKALGEGQGKNTDVEQRLMMKGAADRSVIYHELDFTLKSPIIYCNEGNIIVRSKYLSSKPPASERSVCKQQRMKKTKSCGFDIIKGKTERPLEVEEKNNVRKSHHDLVNSPKSSVFNTPFLTPKFKKNEKMKKTSSHFVSKSKKSSHQSLESDPIDEESDYMFLDFTKKIKQRSKNKSVKLCHKTLTL